VEGDRKTGRDFTRRLCAEFLGTALLLAVIAGSGVMAENLAAGQTGMALLPHSMAIGAILFVLITLLGPVSGAHFNPAVSASFVLRGDMGRREAATYAAVQVAGAIAGVWIAHLMFDLAIIQASAKSRTGLGQWVSELVATFGLILVILGGLKVRPQAIPAMVGLYIMAGLWFTASTSFANPAVTIARALTDTFSGIAPADAPAFIAAQFAGAALALPVARLLWPDEP
jgi:glycerol uptake facilitator-like aquaporin